MICTKCKKEAKLCVFDTFQYYFCTLCKEEVTLEESQEDYIASTYTYPQFGSGDFEGLDAIYYNGFDDERGNK